MENYKRQLLESPCGSLYLTCIRPTSGTYPNNFMAKTIIQENPKSIPGCYTLKWFLPYFFLKFGLGHFTAAFHCITLQFGYIHMWVFCWGWKWFGVMPSRGISNMLDQKASKLRGPIRPGHVRLLLLHAR